MTELGSFCNMEILGIDIGGSGIKGALVDVKSGELTTERFRLETPKTRTPEDVLPVVEEVINHFDYRGAIGVGFPAVVVDGKPVTPFTAHHIEEWVGFSVDKAIEKLVAGCTVTLVNDADAAGIAEMSHGAGVGQKGVVLMITLGTGIGSGMFVNGKLVPNTELGKIYLQGFEEVSEQHFSDAARERRGLKRADWGKELNDYLLYLEWLFTPQLFIIGGGASKKFNRFGDAFTTNAPVVPAKLRNEAGIVGAAMATL